MRDDVARTGERGVRLDSEHDTVCKLAIVAKLVAAGEAGRAGRQDHSLRGQRVGAGPKARIAVAEMAADIEAGPVVDGSSPFVPSAADRRHAAAGIPSP